METCKSSLFSNLQTGGFGCSMFMVDLMFLEEGEAKTMQKEKNGHILPTGQWYAPSADNKHA